MEMTRDTFREELNRFRSDFPRELQPTNLEKSLYLEKKGNIAFLVFDAFQEKANKLSSPIMLRLFELLMDVEKDDSIGCLVAISKKPSIFIAGADIAEIQKLNETGDADKTLIKLQHVFNFLEALPVPSIAAIHGACVGGGMEFALACDYRMATDGPETKLGLPEVQLGVLPGWGGTQRMPRVVGLEKALDLILTGRTIDGKAAKKIGLVDKLAPKEFLLEKATAWATAIAKDRKKRPQRETNLKEKLIDTVPGGKWVVFDQAKKKLMEKTKGHYPAPLKALEVVKKTYGGDLYEGLKVEAAAFTELVATPESKNLIGLFFLNERVKKDKGTEKGVAGIPIQTAGVLGAGVMGGGIAQLFAAKDVRVRMKDIAWDAIARGYQAAHKIFQKQVERRKMKPFDLDNAMARIEGTVTWAGFKNLDIVVEAVVEDIDVKKKVFAELDAIVRPNTILATNTSSLSVAQIGEGCKRQDRVVGMHFFNPVDKMPLVEVIRGPSTSDEAVATVFALAKKLGKTPIVVGDAPGFVVNRILGPYMNETVHLLSEGLTPTEIDRALEDFGMPMGPCALLDEVGLDVATKVAKVLFGAFGERMKPPAIMEGIVAEGRLGKKSKKGIYLYNGKEKSEDPTLLSKLGVKKSGTRLDAKTIQKRLIYLMVNEAARVLEEKLVRDVSDIDVGMIFGTGFAPFRGGLLRYADSVGADAIATDLEVFARTVGPRFQPSGYLQGLAVDKKKFYN